MVTTSLTNLELYPLSKDKYQVRNWAVYNRGLKQRGSLTIWVTNEAVSCWLHSPCCKKRRGAQRFYSEICIEMCLVLRKVYHLALRQTQGFAQSIFELMGIELPVPDYSTLSRRSNGLGVKLSAAGKAVTDIVVDSTGLKVYGEGEWKVRKHGAGKHRTWMKLHIAACGATQQIEAFTLTTNAVDDASEVEGLLAQIEKPVRSLCGDGAYDKDKVRKQLAQKGVRQLIPPQHNAVVDKKKRSHRFQRDEAIREIAASGRAEWKVKQGYHERSKVETVMFRYKTILGGSLTARKFQNQKTEVAVGCKILNIMLQIAKPESRKVA